jgi:hypothetical protein
MLIYFTFLKVFMILHLIFIINFTRTSRYQIKSNILDSLRSDGIGSTTSKKSEMDLFGGKCVKCVYAFMETASR